MIRASIAAFLLVLYLIVILPFILLGFLVRPLFPKLAFNLAKVLTKIPSIIFFILARSTIHVKGLENLSKQKTFLFVGNHKSYMDIPLMIKFAPMPLAFIAKASLKKAPILNLLMVLLGCLFINRESVRQAMGIIKKGIAKLENGESLLIFPEGTRSHTNDLLPFKQGSLKLAEKSHCHVLPFALKGTDEVFGNHGFRVKTSDIWLTIGQPIDLTTLSAEDQKKSAAYIQQVIQEMVSAMKD